MTDSHSQTDRIVVVSGLPRSGTSMVMQMLMAGGLPILSDRVRPADEHNPLGYFEFEPVKRLRIDKSWLPDACGRAVKVISYLLKELSPAHAYDIVFIHRELSEILASQRRMLERSGGRTNSETEARLAAGLTKHLGDIERWLAQQSNMRVLYLEHRDAIVDPLQTAQDIALFLGRQLDVEAMAAVVDQSLYRHRA